MMHLYTFDLEFSVSPKFHQLRNNKYIWFRLLMDTKNKCVHVHKNNTGISLLFFFSWGFRVKRTKKHTPFSLSILSLGLPDLQKVVVIPYARAKQDIDLSKIPNRCVSVDTTTLKC